MPWTRLCLEPDRVLAERIALLLMERLRTEDVIGLEARRSALRHAFGCLSPTVAKPLHERLSAPDPRDPLTMVFMRLSEPTRQEMLRLLEQTLHGTPVTTPPSDQGGLPPAAALRLFQREAAERISEFLALPTRERLQTADVVLRSLRSLATDPRFAEADGHLLRAIQDDTAAMEATLVAYGLQREQNYSSETRRGVGMAAVGAIAFLDGPEPGPADALAGLLALGAFVFVTRTVTTVRDPDLPRRQTEELGELLRRTRRPLTEAPTGPVKPPTPAPQPVPRRTVDVAPAPTDPEQRRRPRRRSCQRMWVSRRGGTAATLYHNEFAAAMVTHFRIPASPEQDFRVTKGGPRSTDYDSFDSETNTYYEFKTKHEYLGNVALDFAWLRLSGLVAQAWDQRMTLINCGIDADLVWIFDNVEAASAARAYLCPWPVDSVLEVQWPRKGPKPGRP